MDRGGQIENRGAEVKLIEAWFRGKFFRGEANFP